MISKTGRSLFFEAKHNDQHLKYDEYDIDTTSRDRNYSDINAQQSKNNDNGSRITSHKQILTPRSSTGGDIDKQKNQFQFNERELTLLKKRYQNLFNRFGKMSMKGVMDINSFKDSLGIMKVSHASFLSDGIFNLMDQKQVGKVNFDDFVRYLNTLMNGSQLQKAQMSFDFLDFDNKGVIVQTDFERMIKDVVIFWNYLTGSRVVPDKTYVDKIIQCFDGKNNYQITFQKYCKKYDVLNDILDWFEFFNPENKIILEQKVENDDLLLDLKKPAYTSQINQTIDLLQDSIYDCILQMKEQKTNKSVLRQFGYSQPQQSRLESNISKSVDLSFDGPLCMSIPVQSKQGDQDPADDVSEFNQILANQQLLLSQISRFDPCNTSYNDFTNQLNSNYLTNIDDKLSNMLRAIDTDQLEQSCSILQSYKFSNKFDEILDDVTSAPTIRRTTMANIPPKKTSMKKNISVYFGHQNWNLILNMMVGMRTALKSLQPKIFLLDLKNEEFSTKYQHDIITQRSYNFDFRKAFKFIDYSPTIFERIRVGYTNKLIVRFGIQQNEYLRSIGPENMLGNIIMGKLSSLTELSSSGKSGSFFYFTEDSKYMIKTISKGEAQFLRKILKQYYQHIMDNPCTLISRIFGLHQMRIQQTKTKSKKVYLTVMANIFPSPTEIDIRFDLKGSLYGRKTKTRKNQKVDKNIALKDQDLLDFQVRLCLEPKERQLFVKQIISDSLFFEQNGIIDYSLLIGIHKLDSSSRREQFVGNKVFWDNSSKFQRFYEKDIGGMISRKQDCIYFIGIIDILTEYNTRKKMEYQIKTTFVDSKVSCVPPPQYAQRFKDFVLRQVVE